MRLEPTQQVISAQVWVCHDCGAQDHKSCGCAGATAYSEALLEKRAQDRARQRRHREKSNENNEHVTRDTNVVNTDEFQPPYQERLYEEACRFLEVMTEATRQRFFAHLTEKYQCAIIAIRQPERVSA
jgi:hypothetical protein